MKRWLWISFLAACGGTNAPVAAPRANDSLTVSHRASAQPRQPGEALVRNHVAERGLDESVALTGELVRFATVASDLPKSRPAFEGMAAHLERYARASGLTFRVFGDHDAWIVEYGDGEPSIAFVMHGDVVPAGDAGWTHAPFEAKLVDNRLYGRGSEDDKGPIAAVLVAMRALAQSGYKPRGKIQAVIGTAEEHEWEGMERYVERERHAKHVISIDASFPAVVAESGFVRWQLALPLKSKKSNDCMPALEVNGGEFLTQVPGVATLRVGAPVSEVRTRLGDLRGVAIEGDEREAVVRTSGNAVHSSVAEEGDNAIWRLSDVAGKLRLCSGGIESMLTLLRQRFAADHWGQKLGLAYRHPLMGRLLVVPTVLRIEEGEVRLSINMRRPAGREGVAFKKDLDDALARLKNQFPGLAEKGRYVGDAAMADTSGPLVST
ncbi:MAG TPA: M20/M25/M40 family metallo-hydrolase, partial [Polyangiaceae bacterium]|nr:M20/M25/M40 family metallo-hydrolase [Polyangiaceae bacterium]